MDKDYLVVEGEEEKMSKKVVNVSLAIVGNLFLCFLMVLVEIKNHCDNNDGYTFNDGGWATIDYFFFGLFTAGAIASIIGTISLWKAK